MYNPSIAKFLSVDPLAPSFPWNSAYAFAEGDVIRSIDLDGLEKRIVVSDYYIIGSEPVLDNNGNAMLDGDGNIIAKPIYEMTRQMVYTSSDYSLGGYKTYSNIQKYTKSGTLYVTNVEGLGEITEYRARSRNIVDKAANEFLAPFITIGWGVLGNMVNQANIVAKEGFHPGPAYNSNNNLSWAGTFILDDDWNFIRKPDGWDDNYESFSTMANMTIKFDVTVASIMVGNGFTSNIYPNAFGGSGMGVSASPFLERIAANSVLGMMYKTPSVTTTKTVADFIFPTTEDALDKKVEYSGFVDEAGKFQKHATDFLENLHKSAVDNSSESKQ